MSQFKVEIFNYDDYVHYLSDWVTDQPNGGRGIMTRIAQHLRISTVSMSYVFNRKRHLSEEQAIEVCEFLNLAELEREYFLNLVKFARSGTKKLEEHYRAHLKALHERSQSVRNRVSQFKSLDEKAKGIFYSNWYYSAARLLTSIEEYQDLKRLNEIVDLSPIKLREVIDFLISTELCIERQGKIVMGTKRTHVDAKSPHVNSHHRNWRLQGLNAMTSHKDSENLFFTGPMTLSQDSFEELKKLVLTLISEKAKIVDPAPSEMLACLNIDLFKLTK